MEVVIRKYLYEVMVNEKLYHKIGYTYIIQLCKESVYASKLK